MVSHHQWYGHALVYSYRFFLCIRMQGSFFKPFVWYQKIVSDIIVSVDSKILLVVNDLSTEIFCVAFLSITITCCKKIAKPFSTTFGVPFFNWHPIYPGVKQILQNPWELINFSSPAKIHMDSFLSVFNIAGLHDELYHNCRNCSAILPYESCCVC